MDVCTAPVLCTAAAVHAFFGVWRRKKIGACGTLPGKETESVWCLMTVFKLSNNGVNKVGS